MSDENFVEEVLENEESIPNLAEMDKEIKETLESINIEITEEDKLRYKPRKRGRKPKGSNAEEINNMSEDELLDSAEHSSDDDVKRLYYEFNSFLLDKQQIKEDTGVKVVVPTYIDLLDSVLGGGLAVGTFDMIVGQSGGGKSMLAMQILAAWQKFFKGDVLVNCLDTEYSITTVRLANLGVRYPLIKPYTDLTLERVFKFIEGLCLFKEMKNMIDEPSIVMLDSISNTLTEKEKAAEDPNSLVAYKSRFLSLFLPRYIPKLSQYNVTILSINQLRDQMNLNPYSPAPKSLNFMRQGKTIPGGNSLIYNSFHLLDLRVDGGLTNKLEKDYEFAGIVAETKAVKNKLFSPNIPVNLIGNFTTGFSNFWTNFVFLRDNNYIKNAGGWNTLSGSAKFRTKEAESIYNSDETFRKDFDIASKEAIKKEIIDKYSMDLSYLEETLTDNKVEQTKN